MSATIMAIGREAAMAKLLERDAIANDRVIEIRAEEAMAMPRFDLPYGNRKERRSYGSSKKRMKGLRP